MSDPTNTESADALDELGDLYELDGAAVYRTVAYRNAAKAIRDAPVSVTALAREGRATELVGVGHIIQEKIIALADTGEIPTLVKMRAKFPPGLIAITRLPGLGPKRARRLYDELGIDSLESLRTAADEHKIRALKGFGPKAEEAILANLRLDGAGERPARIVLSRALAVGEPLVAALRDHPAAIDVELAGSARRMTDTVKDLDVIATATDPLALGRAAAELDLVEEAGTASAAGVRLRTHTGVRVDLRIVEPDQFGNLLQHLTGSKEHNMALREAAVRKGLHVSEYGVLDDATGETHRCATEHEVYALLGLEYIEPELRENRGELEAAAAGTLPDLITRARPRMAPPRSRRWPRPPGTPAMSTWPSPTTRPASGSATRSRPSGCASRSLGSGRRRSTGSSCWRARRSTSSPTARSTTPMSCWPSSTGSSRPCTRRSACQPTR